MYKERIFDRNPVDQFNESILYSEELFRKKNYLDALLIQGSIIENLLIFILQSRVANLIDDVEDEDFWIDRFIDFIERSSLYQRIELCAALAVIDKKFYIMLHEYRKNRNILVHQAFLKTLEEKKAHKSFNEGKKIIACLVKKTDF